MRTKFLTLVALLVAGAVRADVVLQNTAPDDTVSSTSATRTITINSNGSGQTLTFLKLFNVAFDTVRFSINGGTAAYITSDVNGLFDLSTLTGSLTTNGNNTLGLDLLDAGYEQHSSDVSTATAFGNSIGISGGFVNDNAGFLRYQLQAVPEPGTMLMGGIAAAVGGAGAWWKRRKQRRAAAEAAATPA